MGNLSTELLRFPFRAAVFGVSQVIAAPSAFRLDVPDSAWLPHGERPLALGDQRLNGLAFGNPSGRDCLYRGIVDSMFGTFMHAASQPSNTIKAVVDLTLNWPDMVRLAAPGRANRIAWMEFRNKVDAFRWFATADTTLQFPQEGKRDLSMLLHRVDALEPYQGLWTLEGLGFYYAAAALQNSACSSSLFAGRLGQQLPARYLVPLHTGMGLAFASNLLESCTTESPAMQLRQQTDRFVRLCRDNAKTGYSGAGIEALGLIARIVRPRLVPLLDKQLLSMERELAGQFWHGVGRGLYFSPTNVLPCSSVVWPSLRKACAEPPHELARLNAVAGFAWAATLVNLRDPEVLEMLLSRHGSELLHTDAFANGVRSAAIVWHDWAPGTPYLEQICSYQAKITRSDSVESWNRNATSHCHGVLQRTYDALKRRGRLDDVFEYRPL